MSEPGWNPTSEPGSDVPEDLTLAQGQNPGPGQDGRAMSEPGWNPTSEPGSDVPEDLTPAQGQNPGPGQDGRAMSEPGWNPTSEPGSDVPEDLTLAQGQNPGPGQHPPAPSADPHAGLVPSSRSNRTEDDQKDEELKEDDGADDDDDASRNENLAARILSRLSPVAQGTRSAAKQGVQIARCYPRASMASGLSVAILSGVMVLQPGKGKHDTMAQTPSTAAPSQTAPADAQASSNAGSSAGRPDDPAPGSSQALAGSDLPALPEGPDGKAGKALPDPAPKLLASEKAAPAPAGGDAPGSDFTAAGDPRPAPAPAPTETAPLPAVDPVNLAADEGPVSLPPVGGDPAPVVSGAGEKANDPATVPPVLELAVADTKLGTPPGPASAPAPAPDPAPSSTSAPAASPTPAPAPAPAPVPAGDHASAAPAGTAKAAAVAGGVGLGVGAGVGAAVTALSKGNDSKEQGKEKDQAKPAPAAEPLIAPAPALSAPAPTASAPALAPIAPSVEPTPLDLHGGPAPEPAKTGATPAPYEPPGAAAEPVPVPVPRSRTGACFLFRSFRSRATVSAGRPPHDSLGGRPRPGQER